MDITDLQKREILQIAKEAISRYVTNLERLDVKYAQKIAPELSSKKEGVFVTIYVSGELRGCIGFTYPVESFLKSLIDSAILSASEDPRFEPLNKDDLGRMNIEVTILEKPIQVDKDKIQEEIKLGEDGLIVSSPYASGLLLPQVAVEEKFNPMSFVEATCLKAGLSRNAWKDKDVNILKFRGHYFRDESSGSL
ncbi:MAG: AmmeMemoRadiSam system protein A [Candidatus Parvarchaeota archaeon]|nr:AmmeMemoRadiSam system protein A [Candidatus Parvarchaeota archaeon]MCW1301914.1 AmmeMemoRadiSam system protein A [Candidatus Parvarchaeota archaeon]